MSRKQNLISLREEVARILQQFYQGLSPQEKAQEGSLEHWSIKHILYHIALWDQRQAENLWAALEGRPQVDHSQYLAINDQDFPEYQRIAGRMWSVSWRARSRPCCRCCRLSRMSSWRAPSSWRAAKAGRPGEGSRGRSWVTRCCISASTWCSRVAPSRRWRSCWISRRRGAPWMTVRSGRGWRAITRPVITPWRGIKSRRRRSWPRRCASTRGCRSGRSRIRTWLCSGREETTPALPDPHPVPHPDPLPKGEGMWWRARSLGFRER